MASDLPVDLLENIFLRLDDAADLARASAACTCFRRVVSARRFLRRFRPPALGLLLDDPNHSEAEFRPAQSPRRSAQAAAGLDFTFSSLPDDRKRWRVLLLARCPRRHYMCEDHVVYDPLRRRHVQIPTIPRDLQLLAAEHGIDGRNQVVTFDDPFLAPPAAEDERDDDDVSSSRRSSSG